jgi:hypothetical protein
MLSNQMGAGQQAREWMQAQVQEPSKEQRPAGPQSADPLGVRRMPAGHRPGRGQG